MVANLQILSEAVDLSTLDRKLADAIQKRGLDVIRAEIDDHGFSEIKIDDKVFRITKENQTAA
jgi:hypothetical protein